MKIFADINFAPLGSSNMQNSTLFGRNCRETFAQNKYLFFSFFSFTKKFHRITLGANMMDCRELCEEPKKMFLCLHLILNSVIIAEKLLWVQKFLMLTKGPHQKRSLIEIYYSLECANCLLVFFTHFTSRHKSDNECLLLRKIASFLKWTRTQVSQNSS